MCDQPWSMPSHQRDIHLDKFVAASAQRQEVGSWRVPNPFPLGVGQVMYLQFALGVSTALAFKFVAVHDLQPDFLPARITVIFDGHSAPQTKTLQIVTLGTPA